ncbi:cell division protein FtsX [Paroceanicella profunda]|uniref:Cell division protein FtsX n=1 Tax=Paroceanicella profunda TaxID=2579971 RepID=A0A5B8FHL2_9RHOB|nr:cell division protein FtsX [Paroceanicella profunda]QDL92158.1 cell division protein FtsX [Paroceanicella profunda]
MTRAELSRLVTGDREADGVVPATGFTALMVGFSSAAMAFLAVAAICLGLAAARLADRWSTEFAHAATVRISGPSAELDARVTAALELLEATPGIVSARALTEGEQRALLTPWLGEGIPFDALPVPRLIEIIESSAGPDRDSLRQHLAGEVPGAIYDDHTRWRRPLLRAAGGMQMLAVVAVTLVVLLMAVMVMLAARSSLAANQSVILTLRLIGAGDAFIMRAFVRRFTLRALAGALTGTVLALIVLFALPGAGREDAFITGLTPTGWGWLMLPMVPFTAAFAAFWSTRWATRYALRQVL